MKFDRCEGPCACGAEERIRLAEILNRMSSPEYLSEVGFDQWIEDQDGAVLMLQVFLACRAKHHRDPEVRELARRMLGMREFSVFNVPEGKLAERCAEYLEYERRVR